MLELQGKFQLGLLSTVQRAVAMANNVYFGGWDNEGRGDVVVTDGVIIGVVPVHRRESDDEPGAVPVDAWKRAMSGTSAEEVRQVKLEKNWIKVNDENGSPVVVVPRAESETKMPDYKKVIPPAKTQKIAVTIDPLRLAKLSRILGSPDKLTLHMDADPKIGVVHKTVRVSVDPWDGDDQPHGAIVPALIVKDRDGEEIKWAKKASDLVVVNS